MRSTRGVAGALILAAVLAGCASTRATPTSGATTSTSGVVRVSGQVLAEPGCPGPAKLESPCPPRPVPGATVDVEWNGRRIAEVTSEAGGHFQLQLPPGVYRIVATSPSPMKSTSGKDVTVATAPVTVDLTVDSGMR